MSNLQIDLNVATTKLATRVGELELENAIQLSYIRTLEAKLEEYEKPQTEEK